MFVLVQVYGGVLTAHWRDTRQVTKKRGDNWQAYTSCNTLAKREEEMKKKRWVRSTPLLHLVPLHTLKFFSKREVSLHTTLSTVVVGFFSDNIGDQGGRSARSLGGVALASTFLWIEGIVSQRTLKKITVLALPLQSNRKHIKTDGLN